MSQREWWRSYFDDDFVALYRHLLNPERTAREVAALREMLPLDAHARVLDLACGWGRHSVALAAAGFRVTGIDYSEALLAAARAHAEQAAVPVQFLRVDMRELTFDGAFDAVLSLFSSLGYFLSDAEDLRVLRGAARALRPGAWFVLETMHRDHLAGVYAERDWWETPDGTVVWAEREFDAVAGVSREWTRWSHRGSLGEKYHEIRLRNATEWSTLLRAAALEPIEWYGDWERSPFLHTSEDLIVVARKR